MAARGTRGPYAVEPFYVSFGWRLRRARCAAGLTLAEAASRLKPPRTGASLSFMEQGKQRVPLHVATELAAVLGTTLEALAAPSRAARRWLALRDEA